MDRREAIIALATGGSAAFLTSGRVAWAGDGADVTGGAPVTPATYKLAPLPFDPKSLKGLSEKLIVSHHENNYGGAVKNLNKVQDELRAVTKDTPGFVVSGLKERELSFTNSVILHEFYFGNLGGDGKAAGRIPKAISDAFGSFGRWEELFRATGSSLAGGSGWTVLGFNFHTGDLRTYWSGNHTQALSFGNPLLVMDMYEHAYQMDFGAAAGGYIDAFFANLQWEAVNHRYERALEARKAIRG